MKNITVLSFAFGLLFLVSCKKTELDDKQELNPSIDASLIDKSNAIQASAWTIANNWKTENKKNVVEQQTSVSDILITPDVAEKGLVLVFSKLNNVIRSLPFTEGETTWHYEISKNTIVISASSASDNSIDKAQSFAYIILSEDQLVKLQEKGYTKLELLNSKYEEIIKIL